jgi:hypothetical protein
VRPRPPCLQESLQVGDTTTSLPVLLTAQVPAGPCHPSLPPSPSPCRSLHPLATLPRTMSAHNATRTLTRTHVRRSAHNDHLFPCCCSPHHHGSLCPPSTTQRRSFLLQSIVYRKQFREAFYARLNSDLEAAVAAKDRCSSPCGVCTVVVSYC